MFGCILHKAVDQFFLINLRSADIDAQYRNIAIVAVKTGDQPRMGTGAAAGTYDPIDTDAHFKGLSQDFLSTGDVTGGAHRSGSAAGDNVGFAALVCRLVS